MNTLPPTDSCWPGFSILTAREIATECEFKSSAAPDRESVGIFNPLFQFSPNPGAFAQPFQSISWRAPMEAGRGGVSIQK
jgi:hypothetical protein